MTTIVQILTQIFLRVIKLILCFAFAPIPIALAADDEGRSKAVQYFLFAASVGLEAVIIYLATNIYAIGLSGLSSSVASTSSISTIVAMLFLNRNVFSCNSVWKSICREINRRSLKYG